MNVERLYIIGMPVCIGLYWVVFQLTSEWFVRGVSGILLFGGLSVVGRYLAREEADG